MGSGRRLKSGTGQWTFCEEKVVMKASGHPAALAHHGQCGRKGWWLTLSTSASRRTRPCVTELSRKPPEIPQPCTSTSYYSVNHNLKARKVPKVEACTFLGSSMHPTFQNSLLK